MPAQKLVIVLALADPERPGQVTPALFQAAVAAAMEHEVEVVCTGAAARLMRAGIAAAQAAGPGHSGTLHDLIRQAHEAGARFLACTAQLELSGRGDDPLIPECAGFVGAAYIVEQALAEGVRILTY